MRVNILATLKKAIIRNHRRVAELSIRTDGYAVVSEVKIRALDKSGSLQSLVGSLPV